MASSPGRGQLSVDRRDVGRGSNPTGPAMKRNMDRLKALERCFVGAIVASLLCIAAAAVAETAVAPLARAGRTVTGAAAERTAEISLPVAITVFPGETYQSPETWARRAYRNLIRFHEVDRGGHFAAREQPEFFSAEIRAAFRSLRAGDRASRVRRT
jgi:pimeloyl-ACP methyl ester carboxylesterase